MIPCPLLSEVPVVARALDDELAYQNSLINTDRAGDQDNGIHGQILVLEEYVAKMRTAWVSKGDHEALRECLHLMRKCAGTALRALLLYGCPFREWNR